MNTEQLLKSAPAGGSVCRSIRDELLEEPAQPLLRDGEENPFRNVWEAEAFAMGNLLIRRGFMTVQEWVEVFSQEIRAAQAQGDPDRGDTYYSHWMNALERIFIERGLVDFPALRERQRLWGLARKNTPHGVALSLDHASLPPDEDHDHDHDHRHEHSAMPPGGMPRPLSITTRDGPMQPPA